MLNTKTVEEYFQEFGKFFNSQGNPLKIPSIHVYTRTDNYYYSPGKSKIRRKRQVEIGVESRARVSHAFIAMKEGGEGEEREGEGRRRGGRRPVEGEETGLYKQFSVSHYRLH